MSSKQRILFICLLLGSFQFQLKAQKVLQATNEMMGGGGSGGMGGFSGGRPAAKKGNDSLQLRDKNADSITIYYKLYNSNEIKKMDTSINDFFVHYPVPYTNYNLGN
jgi:hypothetical protein